MPDYSVIGDVSATLEKLLADGMATLSPPATAELHDLAGNPSLTPARLTLFLFEVIEDPSARNRPNRRQSSGNQVVMTKAPVALLLRYLLTPWSGDRITDHRILGKAIEVLYDHPILSGPQLQGALAAESQALKITRCRVSLEDLARVWYAVQKPYRLSVTYEVRVVNLDSTTSQSVPAVASRTLIPAVPE